MDSRDSHRPSATLLHLNTMRHTILHTRSYPTATAPLRMVRNLALMGMAIGVAACGGSSEESTPGGSSATGFELDTISVPNNAVWQLNRSIEFSFTRAVAMSSINSSSINIATLAGKPALGDFFKKTVPAPGGSETVLHNVIVWQPRCPTVADLSDAGLDAGGVTYQVLVQGSDISAGIAVKSQSGAVLKNSQARYFATPNSTDPNVVFFDPLPGPPSIVVREEGSVISDASYIEVANDPNQRIYFEQDVFGNPITVLNAPVNLLSDSTQAIAVVLEFDQPIGTAPANIDSDKLTLEFFDTELGVWTPLQADAELEANCTKAGARVRLEPSGILPQDSLVRVRLGAGLLDLVGQTVQSDQINVARFRTASLSVPGLSPEGDLADELFESFDAAGLSSGSLEDTQAVFLEPKALWGAGVLAPNFSFLGTGGPGGTFDVEFTGTTNFSTLSQPVIGGPGFVPTVEQIATGGILNVRNFRIVAGAQVNVQGSNPLRIFATGSVEILGQLIADGVDGTRVVQLNTPFLPELGAPGRAGGGTGGTGSPVTNNSTPKGGDGQGAFGAPGLGGIGGETGYRQGAEALRRAGGGGGGRFAANVNVQGTTEQGAAGMGGSPDALGAVSQSAPPVGGLVGVVPFFDGNNANDFFGLRRETNGTLTVGEMAIPLAGAGGGAGGDSISSNTFPQPNWGTNQSYLNEGKGAGGAGGGGQIQIFSIGNIVLGQGGRIFARGGKGDRGESAIWFEVYAGSAGGASGGHVILQSGANIVVQGTIQTGAISTIGGLPGEPPQNQTLTTVLAQQAGGGRGGAGIVQLHVQDASRIVDGTGVGLTAAQRNTLCVPDPYVLVPEFDRISKARSKFVPLGGANQNPGSMLNQVLFNFEGTDPDPLAALPGAILTVGENVQPVDPILIGTPLSIDSGALRIVLDAADLVDDDNDPKTQFFDDVYLRNPNLLKQFGVRFTQGLLTRTYTVATAAYDPVLVRLTLDLEPTGAPLSDFTPGIANFALVPRFFRVATGVNLDVVPTNTAVQIRFQAVAAGNDGQPDLVAPPLVDWTPDITEFNNPGLGGEIGFFRFEVEFNLDVGGAGLNASAPRPALRFLRVPFKF